jgi:hypothetical protein
MKLSTPLIILASVTGTIAGCYSSSGTFIQDCDKNAFRGAVRDLCRGPLSGYFDSPGTNRTICANSPCNNTIAHFTVGWEGRGGGHTLAAGDCELRLNNEINGCNHGGESIVADWFFR